MGCAAHPEGLYPIEVDVRGINRGILDLADGAIYLMADN